MNSSMAEGKATTKEPILRAEGLTKAYENGAIPVLHGVSLQVYPQQTVALCGPSGCGKSTLLHLLGGLDAPDAGEIVVRGQPLRPGRMVQEMLRHQVGFVFQLHNLLPDLTLTENCLIPTVAAGVPRAEAMERLHHLADRTGLSHRLQQRIQKLSGGERQRTALCRALMNRPSILLADEPTGALDEATSRQIFGLLLELVEREGITLVMATHDRALAARCDRLLEMHDGKMMDSAGSSARTAG